MSNKPMLLRIVEKLTPARAERRHPMAPLPSLERADLDHVAGGGAEDSAVCAAAVGLGAAGGIKNGPYGVAWGAVQGAVSTPECWSQLSGPHVDETDRGGPNHDGVIPSGEPTGGNDYSGTISYNSPEHQAERAAEADRIQDMEQDILDD